MGAVGPTGGQFRLVAPFRPAGDQPEAIAQLSEGIRSGIRHQVLLGATGTGKTFTMASVIAAAGRPTLVISPNKTLAAQLYAEFAEFFPENRVEYFVSYYDYYQPEAYLPSTDTYIEKDAAINDHIDRLRLKATSALLERRDVIIVASVSCIYGLGSPKDYREMLVSIEKGQSRPRDAFLADLVAVQYTRNDVDFRRGAFRVRGDTVEIFPAYLEVAYRVWLDLDEVMRIAEIHPVTGEVVRDVDRLFIYPAKHFVTPRATLERAVVAIRAELSDRLAELRAQGKMVEAQRLESRANYDCEMLLELGYCSGIENYSRHIAARAAGERPSCLLDYFPEDYLLMIDESHVTVPQIGGMYEGDRSRKDTLVAYGFRLPSALDNRPLKFAEFETLAPPTIYLSATPGPYELRKSGGVIAEQIIRPTGLVDPEVSIRPTTGQVEDLILEIHACVARRERTLVTTLTKRMAEELTAFLLERDLRVRYLHSDIDTLTRIEILRDLRKGEFDVLVGINLLREGLDLPEVSLVAVLDADQEGFLRSQTSLIQVSGRAARNVNGRVIMYADQVTGSMARALAEMRRRREKQTAYNLEHHVTPTTIVKAIQEYESLTEKAHSRGVMMVRDGYAVYGADSGRIGAASDPLSRGASGGAQAPPGRSGGARPAIRDVVAQIEREMQAAADRLDFELAASFRDQLFELKGVAPSTTGGDPRAGLSALGKGKKKPMPRFRRVRGHA